MAEPETMPNTDNGGGDWTPSVVVLYCQRAFGSGEIPPERPRAAGGADVRLMMLPCSSKVECWHLLQILDAGRDGVEVVCCPAGACQFLDGNLRAERRIERARMLLDSIGVGADRIGLSRGSNLDEGDLLGRAQARADAVRTLGPNPARKAETQ